MYAVGSVHNGVCSRTTRIKRPANKITAILLRIDRWPRIRLLLPDADGVMALRVVRKNSFRRCVHASWRTSARMLVCVRVRANM